MTDLTKITLSLYVWHLLIKSSEGFGSEFLFLPIPLFRPFQMTHQNYL